MRFGKRSFEFEKKIYLATGYTIAGPKENDGNFGDDFDLIIHDDLWDEKSFEKCEAKMHREAIKGAINKAGLKEDEIELLLCGDLLNELSASNMAARAFETAFMGLYNACATFGEALALGAMLIDGGFFETISCSTSSHFSSAERQYRFPLELGNQRTPTAQWTVTAAGCSILTSNKKKERKKAEEKTVLLKGATIGRVIDMGIQDESNMGAAMAPAAADTLITHLREMNRDFDYYDAILTGDLGRHGKKMLSILLNEENMTLPETYDDIGALFYKPEQKSLQGASGAGCSSAGFNAHFLKRMKSGALKKVLLIPTGALLNKDTPLQKESIPAVAHAVWFEAVDN